MFKVIKYEGKARRGKFQCAHGGEVQTPVFMSVGTQAAIKGGDSISRAEAEQLIDELLSLENPYHCPHGRPTIISMSKYEIEKKFKRIV